MGYRRGNFGLGYVFARPANAAGTYEVTDFKRAFGANILTAASSATALTAEEVDNTWKHVQNVSSVRAVEAKSWVTCGFVVWRIQIMSRSQKSIRYIYIYT